MKLPSQQRAPRSKARARRSNEGGYALLVIIFLATVMLLATMTVAPNVLTEGKREQEKEMIWRGKQYVRGVKLYYRKMGRFPTSLEDLTKPKVGSLRFMRQAYKDPMNKTDGTWRLIYVGPSGQLIGSLKPNPLNLRIPQAGGIGSPANPPAAPTSAPQTGGTAPSGQPGHLGLQPGGTAPGADQSASGTSSAATPAGAGTTPTGSGTTGAPAGTDQSDSGTTAQPTPLTDTSNIIGGNIIGVGSKIDQPSIIIYDKAKNYHFFEFIWDPSKDIVTVGQPGLQTGTGLGQPIGQSPFGQQSGQNPTNPQQNPPPPQVQQQ